MDVLVTYEDQEKTLPLLVVSGSGPSLFGRNWLAEIRLDKRAINSIRGKTLHEVLNSHREVFKEELGKLKGHEAKIYIDSVAQPCFCKARSHMP